MLDEQNNNDVSESSDGKPAQPASGFSTPSQVNPEKVAAENLAAQKPTTEKAVLARFAPAITTLGRFESVQQLLESYVKQNQGHIQGIFILSCIAMGLGFLIICAGIYLAAFRANGIGVPLIASVSGVLTEFIGVTF